MKNFMFTMFLLIVPLSVFASTPQDIQNVSQKWGIALSSTQPEKITGLYDKEAIIYPTFENKLNSTAQIQDYFKNLMQKPDLRVHFDDKNIRVFGDVAVNSGFYTFSYSENGKTIKVPARYTFVYVKKPQGWLIVDHHSSVMPKAS